MNYWIEYYFFSANYATRIAAWMGVSLLILSVFLIIFIFISRKSSQRRNARVVELTDKYETLLTNILFEEAYSTYSKGYRSVINSIKGKDFDRVKRTTLIHVIIRAKDNILGDSQKILANFYHELNLKKYANRELKTGRWYEKAFAVQELGKMDVRESLPSIMTLTNHPNLILRSEAQYAAIDLAGDRALHFLEELDYPLSRWQQIRILEELDKLPRTELPSFYGLLEVNNSTVVEFGLRLIAHFNQLDHPEKFKEVIAIKDDKILIALASMVRDLELQDMVGPILERFHTFSSDVKVEMTRAIGEVGTLEEQDEFLFGLLHEKDYRVAMAAAESIYELSGSKISSDMLQRAGSRALFLKHVVDERKH